MPQGVGVQIPLGPPILEEGIVSQIGRLAGSKVRCIAGSSPVPSSSF